MNYIVTAMIRTEAGDQYTSRTEARAVHFIGNVLDEQLNHAVCPFQLIAHAGVAMMNSRLPKNDPRSEVASVTWFKADSLPSTIATLVTLFATHAGARQLRGLDDALMSISNEVSSRYQPETYDNIESLLQAIHKETS